MRVRTHFFLALALAFSQVPIAKATSNSTDPYFDTRTSTPEARGLSSDRLADMLAAIQREDHNIHNVSIIRNGQLVLDAPIFPHVRNNKHTIHSCTKSVTSTLIGIAIEQGYIESVRTPVLDFFPTRVVANLDSRKEAMTLEHLLTMTSGFDCQDTWVYDWRGMDEMQQSGDWVLHVLNLPMVALPGELYRYCNGVSLLLSAIIQEVTGKNTLEFAHENLFGPLGIADVEWPATPQGTTIGWGRMRLRPHDMAKFGLLFLNEGRWEGQQVVPSSWVRESTTQRVATSDVFGTVSDGYGYQWWVDAQGYYMAAGFGGQLIFIIPDQNIIAVFTSGVSLTDFHTPERLLQDYVIPAAISPTPLTENPSGLSQLRSIMSALENPSPAPVAALPAMAHVISGRRYIFDPNNFDFHSFSLSFRAGSNEALFDFSYRDRNLVQLPVGLDDVPRVTEAEGYLRAYKGTWLGDDRFFMSYQVVGYSENGTFDMRFSGDEALVTFTVRTSERTTDLRARAR
jgi:CubicO group peptidase (beta-lactamase class C family)